MTTRDWLIVAAVVGSVPMPLGVWARQVAGARSDFGGVIVGTVADAITGRGIPGVRVGVAGSVAAAAPRSGLRPSVQANAAGEFVVRGLPNGSHVVFAEADGYLRGGAGQDAPWAVAERTLLSSENTAKEVRIRLWPAAEIIGTLVDDQDQPLAGHTIRLWPLQDPSRSATVQTDGAGGFAFRGLAAGRYLVGRFTTVSATGTAPRNSASAIDVSSLISSDLGRHNVLLRDSANGTAARTLWTSKGQLFVRAPAYATRADSPIAASPIVVRSGDRVLGVRLMASGVITTTVDGRVFDGAGPVRGALVTLVQPGENIDDPSWTVPISQTSSNASGEYRLWGVPAGAYRVIASRAPSGELPGEVVGGPWGSAIDRVTAEAHRVAHVDLTLSPGVMVRGVAMQGGESTPRVQIALRPVGGPVLYAPREPVRFTSGADGRFEAGPLRPGRYRVTASGEFPQMLASVRLGPDEFFERALSLTSDVHDLRLVMAREQSRLTVRASPALREAVAVLVFPADMTQSPEPGDGRYRRAVIRVGASSSFLDLPPGAYRVLTVPLAAVPGDWPDPDLLRRLPRTGEAVVHVTGRSTDVQVPHAAISER